MENEIIEAVEAVQIRVENGVVTAFAEVGGYTDGITIERNILPLGFNFKVGKYLYADGVVSVNADYVEPTTAAELTQEEINLDLDFRLTSLELGL